MNTNKVCLFVYERRFWHFYVGLTGNVSMKLQIKVVKILQELAESEHKAGHPNIKEKDGEYEGLSINIDGNWHII